MSITVGGKSLRCVVRNCGAVGHQDQRADFFTFPSSRAFKARSIWLRNINLDLSFTPTRYDCVCRKHFMDGHPTGLNPYPTLHLGFDESIQLSHNSDSYTESPNIGDLTRQSSSAYVLNGLRANYIKYHARKALGLPIESTKCEAALEPKKGQLLHYSNYCMVAGCPNSAFISRQFGMQCKSELFSIESAKNDPVIHAAWRKFAGMVVKSNKNSPTPCSICALHFTDGKLTEENPIPTVIPDFELSTDPIGGGTCFILKKPNPAVIKQPTRSVSIMTKDGKVVRVVKVIKKADSALHNLPGPEVSTNLKTGQQSVNKSECSTALDVDDTETLDSESDFQLIIPSLDQLDDTVCLKMTGLRKDVIDCFLDYVETFKHELIVDAEPVSGSLNKLAFELLVSIRIGNISRLQNDPLMLHFQESKHLLSFFTTFSTKLSDLVFWPKNLLLIPSESETNTTRIGGILDMFKVKQRGLKFFIVFNLSGAIVYRSRTYRSSISQEVAFNEIMAEISEKLKLSDTFDKLTVLTTLIDFVNHSRLKKQTRWNLKGQLLQNFYRDRFLAYDYQILSDFLDKKTEHARATTSVLDKILDLTCALVNLNEAIQYENLTL